MSENSKNYLKIKETKNLKKLQEETSINSPSRLNETNIIQSNEKTNINLQVKNEKFKFKGHYKNKGNIHMFLFDENGIPKIVIGPHCKKWKYNYNYNINYSIFIIGKFVIILELSMGIITIPFYFFFRNYLNRIILLIGIIIYLSFVIFHLTTSLINPGLPTKEYFLENFNMNNSKIKNYVICKKCKVIMDLDKGTEHCVDCDICVIENDHHCQWAGKCIGKNNLLLFKMFMSLNFINILYLVFALIIMFIYSF